MSKFSHPSRVALIFAAGPDHPVMALEPQDLPQDLPKGLPQGHGVKICTTIGGPCASIHRNRLFWKTI